MPIRAIVFDVDGVLVDSDAAIVRSFRHTLVKFGFKAPSDEEILVYGGLDVENWIRMLLPPKKRKDGELLKKMADYSVYHYRHIYLPVMVREKDGAKEVLEKLGKDYALGIATNNTREVVLKLFKVLEFNGYFKAIVAMDDVANPKPAPDPLLKAFSLLGCSAEEAVFVGDSQADLEAGRAAGVRTILVEGKANGKLPADARISSLHELARAIEKLEKK